MASTRSMKRHQMSKNRCQYCNRPTAGDICPAHGYVGNLPPEKPLFPFPGVIVDYSGSASTIPKGWALCDGSNGTPDLRNKFIVGAGDTYAVGATGGSNVAHTHSLSVSGTSGYAGGHSHTVTPAAHAETNTYDSTATHTHTFSATSGAPSAATSFQNGSGATISRASATHTHYISGTSGNNSTNHSHGIPARSHAEATTSSQAAHAHTTGGTGTSGTASSMPAYYALAKIMFL